MLRVGRVIGSENGQIVVCFERPEACAHCGACDSGRHQTAVKIPGDAPVGSMVTVDMPEKKVLGASMLAYVIPLAMLLLGIALGTVLFQQEALWAACGFVLMLSSYFVLKGIDRAVKGRPGWQPEIVAVYEKGDMDHGTEAE